MDVNMLEVKHINKDSLPMFEGDWDVASQSKETYVLAGRKGPAGTTDLSFSKMGEIPAFNHTISVFAAWGGQGPNVGY